MVHRQTTFLQKKYNTILLTFIKCCDKLTFLVKYYKNTIDIY
jgi:hypothetical protein